MENVSNYINLVMANWDAIVGGALAIFSGIVTLATVINKITPNVVSDNKLGKLIMFADKVASLNNDKTVVKEK